MEIKIKQNRFNNSVRNKITLITVITVCSLWILAAFCLNLLENYFSMKNSNQMINDRLSDINILKKLYGDDLISLSYYGSTLKLGDKGYFGIINLNTNEELIKSTKLKNEIITVITKNLTNMKNDYYEFSYKENNIVMTIFLNNPNYCFFAVYYPKEIYGSLNDNNLRFTLIFTFFSAIIIIFVVSIFISRIIIKPLNILTDKTNLIKNGDLTVNYQIRSKDEIGNMGIAFNDTISTLKILIQKVYIAIIVLTKNLKKLFKSSMRVKDSANAQAVTVEQTVNNFENLNKMVETIAGESSKANLYTSKAFEKAKIGMESMDKLEKEMLKIESSSQEITNIIEMINDIAEQTNLLSLNATIESARAGEAGKGFSIVAGEIRKLANKSTNAANRIHELITNNNKIIQDGVKYSANTTNILKDLSMSNELITSLVQTITDEVQKVKFSSQEILESLTHISDIANANFSESERVSRIMDDFVAQTIELQKYVGQFDIRTDKIKENQKHVENILKVKLAEAEKTLTNFGAYFTFDENLIQIASFELDEMRLGKVLVTGNSELADILSNQINASVTIFQIHDKKLVRVSTTVTNFDDTRAIGTTLTEESKVYQSVVKGDIFYGRAFVVNRWFVAVYRPIFNEEKKIVGALYIGFPEQMELDNSMVSDLMEEDETDHYVKDKTFKHDF